MSENDLKAALLPHFATFVEWPERSFDSTAGDFAVCVLGVDPFGSRLERTFKGKSVRGRSITIRRGAKLRELGTCHLLYVSRSEEKQLGLVMRALAGRSCLTVSDMSSFVDRGGMVQLKRSGSQILFEISRIATDQARLKVSSKLLNLATSVRGSR